MTLKRQLVLLGLITLVLPWLALRHLAEQDASLRDMRIDAQTEHSRSLARLLQRNQEVMQRLQYRAGATPSLWLASLNSSVLDGYLDEWQDSAVPPIYLGVGVLSEPIELKLAHTQSHFRLSLKIPGPPQWYSPQNEAFDAVVIDFESTGRFRLTSSASGLAQPQVWRKRRWQPAFSAGAVSSNGVWLARGGYSTLEWEFPLAYRTEPFSIEFVSARLGYSLFLTRDNSPLYAAYYEPSMLASLQDLVSDQQAFWLLDANGKLVARRGSEPLIERIDSAPSYSSSLLPFSSSPMLMRFYYWVVGRSGSPYVEPYLHSTRLYSTSLQSAGLHSTDLHSIGFNHSSLNKAAADKVGAQGIVEQWLLDGYFSVSRVSMPLEYQSDQVGYLIIDRQQSAFEASLARMAGRFLLVSLLSIVLLLGILLLFASIHSWRIRKLAQRAEKIVDAQYQSHQKSHFVASRIPDEIGQLSRSFEQLVSRLGKHQEYLKNLASKLSHELRTPIAVVQSSLDNIDPTDDQKVYMDRARSGLHRLSSMLSAMSSVNQIESALAQAELEPVPLADLLSDLSEAYGAAYAPCKIVTDIDLPIPCSGLLVPDFFVQMLDKLLDNAVQFSIDQQVELAAWHRGDFLMLTVSNLGPSLPNDIREQLFDSMVSNRQSSSGDVIHMGLGLYVARLICAFHKGTIRAYQTEATAPYFRVTFEVQIPFHIIECES